MLLHRIEEQDGTVVEKPSIGFVAEFGIRTIQLNDPIMLGVDMRNYWSIYKINGGAAEFAG
ncbi:hypothetical protein A6U85_25310 [Agrobacterium sp. 13-626]|nr:hypothetical protein A6U85_25310 [Agrobacterium sp. 13-626]